MKKLIHLFILSSLLMTSQAQTQGQQESLNRGLVAIKNGNNTFLSWRLLGTDSRNTTFDLFRDGNVLAENLKVTNYTATGGTDNSEYQVVVKRNGTAVETSVPVVRWGNIFKTLTMDRPASGTDYHYFPNDCSTGDVDGDGVYEIIVKWDPSNNQDNSKAGKTGNVYLDCYKLDGTKLWRIDLGKNIRAGAHYTQFLVYDFNGDGRAELMCKTAPGTIDGQGEYANQATDDAAIKGYNNRLKYANDQGYILSGPEFLTVFEGLTGRAINTVWYNPNRSFTTGEVKAQTTEICNLWGDSYGNRQDRFLACAAHLDGADKNASAIFCRGYYTRAYLWAVDFDGQQLKTRWLHGSISGSEVELTDAAGNTQTRTYTSNTSGLGEHYTAYGQGCHSVGVGDVDGDGCDEIIFGSAAIDNDGWLLHSTGLGHGDALHLSDLMPDRPGLEVMMVPWHTPAAPSARRILLL